MQKLDNNGVMDRIYRAWNVVTKPKNLGLCETVAGQPIGLEEIYPVFYLLGIGIISSLLMHVAEYVHRKRFPGDMIHVEILA